MKYQYRIRKLTMGSGEVMYLAERATKDDGNIYGSIFWTFPGPRTWRMLGDGAFRSEDDARKVINDDKLVNVANEEIIPC